MDRLSPDCNDCSSFSVVLLLVSSSNIRLVTVFFVAGAVPDDALRRFDELLRRLSGLQRRHVPQRAGRLLHVGRLRQPRRGRAPVPAETGRRLGRHLRQMRWALQVWQVDDGWPHQRGHCAGTTWTQEMVWMIVNDCDYEGGKADLNMRSPFLEFSYLLPTSLGMKRFALAQMDKLPSPRVMKSHLSFDLLNAELLDTCKVPSPSISIDSLRFCFHDLRLRLSTWRATPKTSSSPTSTTTR